MLAPLASLVGGHLLLLHALVGSGALADTMRLLGIALVVVAAAIFGSGLVRSDVQAMRGVTGLTAGLLALSMIEAFRPGTGAATGYYAAWGAVALIVGGVAVLRARRRGTLPHQSGSHAR